MTDSETARNIHQELLDRSGHAMMSVNFEAFAQCFAIPSVIETYEATGEITSMVDMRALFDRLVAERATQRVRDIVRRSTDAAFREDGTIVATHETRYIVEGNILLGPVHTALSVLRQEDGLWKVAFSQYTVEGDNALNKALKSGALPVPTGRTPTPQGAVPELPPKPDKDS